MAEVNANSEVKIENALRLSNEKILQARVLAEFRRYGVEASQELREFGSISNASLAFHASIQATVSPTWRIVIREFARRWLASRGLTYSSDSFETHYQAYLGGVGASSVESMTRTTRRRTARVISLAVRQPNASVASVAAAIRADSGSRYTRARALTIARTETHSAASYATIKAVEESGHDPGSITKVWVALQDGITRDTHASVHGTRKSIDDLFSVGASSMRYPGDPNGAAREVVNCRCTCLYLTAEDEVVGL